MRVKQLFAVLVLSLAGVFGMASLSAAQDGANDPYQQIELVTVELLETIATYQAGYPENEKAYFESLDALLLDRIDFAFIARNVMGSYNKVATTEQRARFATTFRNGLVETYGRGLIGYENQEIVLVKAGTVAEGQRKLTVKQEIRSSDSVYPLEYSMARKKTGQWMVVNVVINGINLGKTFRNQFVRSAQRAGGDIEQVINGWSSESL
jgi:phospholipid transport system substrate-binding protein|tara:strand:- start:81 stop:707 length:627 start_codon:yes stop_codon:yes gene_type:complete